MEDKILSLIRHSDLTRIANDLTSLLRYAVSMKTRSVDDETDLPLYESFRFYLVLC
jgi:hypothetical protein